MGHAIGGELAKNPDKVMGLARRNLERMQRTHTRDEAASHLRTWERILNGPVEGVLYALTSRTPKFVELRVDTSFAGVLDDTTRLAVIRAAREPEVGRT